MRFDFKTVIVGLLLLLAFILSFLKSPQEIQTSLFSAAMSTKTFSLVVHIIFALILTFGLIFRGARNILFFIFLAIVSLSATAAAIVFKLIPNIIVFGLLFILIIRAFLIGKLNFDLQNLPVADAFFGILALVFGFWYFHWVEQPILLTALIFSPMGMLNCPTLLAMIGFLILSSKPHSDLLEAAVAISTIFFGFFGLMRLNAYIDVVLIITSLYLIYRLGTYSHEEAEISASSA
jgi:hypothetical protein